MKIGKVDTTGMWSVDGEPIFVPSNNIQIEHTNVAASSSGRTEDGLMHIDWVRRDVRKVYIQYPALSGTELKSLMDRMQGREFMFTYPDLGVKQSFHGYTGEARYTKYSDALGDDDMYTDISVNVIEI